MSINLLKPHGTPLDRQRLSWTQMAGRPISKLDDDAFSRVRVILLNGLESDALRLQHAALRQHREARPLLAQLMRVEQHQATAISWLLSADHSPIETTIAYEQVAIELTASVAEKEPDPYLAQAYRFALLEDFDHLHRYAALLDRLEGKDANNILQGYTDIAPGRPTPAHHRAPEHDLVAPYARDAALATKFHAITLTAAEYQTHDYYMIIGPLFADPLARQLYAEIASVETQHITQYGSMLNPEESVLEKLLLHEATEVWAYAACVDQESNPRLKAMWERFLDYELTHLSVVSELFETHERRDAAEVLGDGKLPPRIAFRSHRAFVREVLGSELNLGKNGPRFVEGTQEGPTSASYREAVNADGSPSRMISAGYCWAPGGELGRRRDKRAAA